MARKELTAFRIAPGIMAGLRRVKERDGIPLSVQVHRSLVAWLKGKRVRLASTSGRPALKRKAK